MVTAIGNISSMTEWMDWKSMIALHDFSKLMYDVIVQGEERLWYIPLDICCTYIGLTHYPLELLSIAFKLLQAM